MKENHAAKTSTTIKAPASKVWDALTKPELIKQYFFGSEVTTDWKVGSPIIYRGEWEGKPYEDKGKILKVEPHKVIESTYWSPFSGLPDTPENYQTVRYELSGDGDKTRLTVTQENVPTAEEAKRYEENWSAVLGGMKMLLEK